jgi:hypothetical protein
MDALRRLGRSPLVLGIVVVLLVAGGLVLGSSLRAADGPGASEAAAPLPILSGAGVRFRIVGDAAAQPNPNSFVEFSHVVSTKATTTNVVLQNPHGDAGTMRIQVGDQILLEENLADLRDQQYPIPLQVKAGDAVIVALSCQLPGPPEPPTGKCRPSASFFG